MKGFGKFILFGTVILVSSCQNNEGGLSSRKTFSLSEASYGKVVSLVDEPTETIAPGWETGEVVFVGTDVSEGTYAPVQGGNVTADVPSSASKVYVCRAAGNTYCRSRPHHRRRHPSDRLKSGRKLPFCFFRFLLFRLYSEIHRSARTLWNLLNF